MHKINALLALALTLPVSALAQSPKPVSHQRPAEVEKIVASEEFQAATQKRDIARMNQLLQSTGAVASDPVAIFYCRPPTQPAFINGVWYCTGGGVGPVRVQPFMYSSPH